jgi:carbamoylphosphate synthase large subunit
MFALRLKIEWMVRTYGIGHVGLQTMTIRENVTDRKEFERRFKSIATNVFPKLYLDWLRVFERQQRG